MSASPEPTILWLKDGQKLAILNEKHKLLDGGRQLQILDARSGNDAGRYVIKAKIIVMPNFLATLAWPQIQWARLS